MELEECETVREELLWMQLRVAEARIAALEADRRPSQGRGRPRSPNRPAARLSPEELSLHRRRCAARARLFRARLSSHARRKVLEQARALGVIPPGFDEAQFLDGADARAVLPKAEPARGRDAIHGARLLVLEPDEAPEEHADPQLLSFWFGLRLARLDEALDSEELGQLERFVEQLPVQLAREPTRPSRSRPVLRYDDDHTIARDWVGALKYPNGQTIRGADGRLHYPSGRDAFIPRSRAGGRLRAGEPRGTIKYPDGSDFKDAAGRWWSPSGAVGDLNELAGWIRLAAPEMWPQIERGMGRMQRPMLLEVAALELAWALLRAE